MLGFDALAKIPLCVAQFSRKASAGIMASFAGGASRIAASSGGSPRLTSSTGGQPRMKARIGSA